MYIPRVADTLRGRHLKGMIITAQAIFVLGSSEHRVTVIDASVGHVITTIPAQNVFELGFSPLGSFIITWQRPSKDENGDAVKNLKVWSVLEGQATGPREAEHNIVGRFVQKSQTGWNLQYTYDERYCARVVTNEVQFYKSGDLGNVWNKLLVEGVLDFSVSPSENHSIAVFAPERKVSRAFITLRDWSLNIDPGATGSSQSLQRTRVQYACVPEEIFQGRQSAVEMESKGHGIDRLGSD